MSDTSPMSQDRVLGYLADTLNYSWGEAVNAVNGAPAAEDRTYPLARHQVRWDYPGVYFITETPDTGTFFLSPRSTPEPSAALDPARLDAQLDGDAAGCGGSCPCHGMSMSGICGTCCSEEEPSEAPDPHAAGCCHEPEERETALAPGYEPGPGEYESWYLHLASGTARTSETTRPERRPDVHDHEEHRDGTVPGCPACTPDGLIADRAGTEEALRALGYPEGAIRQAVEHAPWTRPEDGPAFLARHSVSGNWGVYQITDHGAAEEARLRAMDGHELSRAQIGKHGRDRYPTPGAQYAKLLDEAGELGEALISGQGSERVRAEYADVGLALYALGDKLGLDLIQVMRELVANDTRDFR